jgi:hypothetical protein
MTYHTHLEVRLMCSTLPVASEQDSGIREVEEVSRRRNMGEVRFLALHREHCHLIFKIFMAPTQLYIQINMLLSPMWS